MDFEQIIQNIGKAVDLAGVVVIIAGGVWSGWLFARALRNGVKGLDAFRTLRQTLGRSILLGLEILVAADIIRTVAASPTFRSVGVLAVIVLIRTFLSVSLEVELTGRWPWSKEPGAS